MTATIPGRTRSARAAAPATAPLRPAQPAPRPGLRVVEPGELTPEARLRRHRRRVFIAGTIAVVSLFALVVFHAVLTQNQFELERLREQANAEQARFDRLRLQVAELESPARVVAAAHELGMVQPPEVRYLAPTRPAASPADDGEPVEAGAEGWSAVKPHLAAQP